MALVLVACGGGGGGGGNSPLLTKDQVAQLAADNGIVQQPDDGTVVVDTSAVRTSSINASAVISDITIELYDPQGGRLDGQFVIDGTLLVFFNVTPGTLEVRVTRGTEVIYSDTVNLDTGMIFDVRPPAPETSNTGSDSSGNTKVLGSWVLVNDLGSDDNGVWGEDDPTGIGEELEVTATSWKERNVGGGLFSPDCEVTSTYTIGGDLRYSLKTQSATPGCGQPENLLWMFDETGRIEFEGDNIMMTFFDVNPGDTLLAYRWMRK